MNSFVCFLGEFEDTKVLLKLSDLYVWPASTTVIPTWKVGKIRSALFTTSFPFGIIIEEVVVTYSRIFIRIPFRKATDLLCFSRHLLFVLNCSKRIFNWESKEKKKPGLFDNENRQFLTLSKSKTFVKKTLWNRKFGFFISFSSLNTQFYES